MLDKTIPYYDIIMKADMDRILSNESKVLPQGYTFKMYAEGDEIDWAKLEVEVEEFKDEKEALGYFNRIFMPYQELLKERMCFILDEHNRMVATSTAWFKEIENCHYPLLHWVSVSNTQQGKGLGKTIVLFALKRFKEVEPNAKAVYLHTQTWSYKAINLYYRLGFKIIENVWIGSKTDVRCYEVLQKVLPKEDVKAMIES